MAALLERIERLASSHQGQLVTTAVVSGAVVAGVILGFQRATRDHAMENLKASIPDLSTEHPATRLTDYGGASGILKVSKEDERSIALARRAREGDYDDDLILEQLARNRVFLKDEGLAKLRGAFIVVVGCGGVGSHAVAALARSGVTKIRLIDFDQVTLSSLNRHALATLADVGTPKVHCIRKRLEQVTPWVHFDCRNELFNVVTADKQLAPMDGQKPDFVIDAIDNIDSKVGLLHYCYTNSLKVISSMGAGCKSDPTRIMIGDISTSTDDPLSKSTRRRLRMLGVKEGIPVVFSTERPGPGKAELLPLAEEEFKKGNVGELGVLPEFRVRILPVIGTMPAMFGMCVANHVIMEITNYPHDYLPSKSREKMYDGIHAHVQGMEERLARAREIDAIGLRVPITPDDVGYLIEEVWKGRSVVSGLSARLVLTRWQAPPADFVSSEYGSQRHTTLKLRDLVCMTKDEAMQHERDVLKPGKKAEEAYKENVVQLVEQVLAEEARFERFR